MISETASSWVLLGIMLGVAFALWKIFIWNKRSPDVWSGGFCKTIDRKICEWENKNRKED